MVLCCTMSSHIIHTLLLYCVFCLCPASAFFFFLFFLFLFFFFFKIKKKIQLWATFFNCFSCTSKKVKDQKHHVCACPEASFRVHWLLLPFLVFCFCFFCFFFCQNKILKNATFFFNCLFFCFLFQRLSLPPLKCLSAFIYISEVSLYFWSFFRIVCFCFVFLSNKKTKKEQLWASQPLVCSRGWACVPLLLFIFLKVLYFWKTFSSKKNHST